MKKLFLGCMCLIALVSCNVKNSKEYKQLKTERDSLVQVNQQSAEEMNEMISVINDIEEGFNQIKTAENYLSLQNKEKGAIANDKKVEIKSQIEMVNNILKKNKTDIARLSQQIKTLKGNTSVLQMTITRLNNELEDRAQKITELQSSLQKRDAEIAELKTSVQVLAEDVNTLSEQTVKQADRIQEQDKELNMAYFMFGTKSELKEAKVISGGFLASTKVLNEEITEEKFVQVDIRETNTIAVYAKKAKILTDHPKDSYSIEKDTVGNAVIKINDYKRFWGISRFLIVEVN